MPIERLFVKNFKGIADQGWVDLKPITLFIGTNSSGKSSCLHALAALSQTAKLPNSTRPLILDDEFAQVHLGRFIDVIHTRRHSDVIELGADLGRIGMIGHPTPGANRTAERTPATFRFAFVCTLRTQNIHLRRADYQIGERTFTVTREKNGGLILRSGNETTGVAIEPTGFLLEPLFAAHINVEQFLPLWLLNRGMEMTLKNILYLSIGPFRQPPLRNYPTRGSSPAEVGAQGEAAVTMLANEIIQRQVRAHATQVARWLEALGVGKNLTVKRVARSDLFDVEVKLADGRAYSVPDLGYGVSQVLPVLVQCSFAPPGATLLFEQPEIHLHPVAAKRLAKIFRETAADKRARLLIETHSPDLVRQFQLDVGDGLLAADDIAIYLVERREGASVLRRMALEVDGEIYDNWQRGFAMDH